MRSSPSSLPVLERARRSRRAKSKIWEREAKEAKEAKEREPGACALWCGTSFSPRSSAFVSKADPRFPVSSRSLNRAEDLSYSWLPLQLVRRRCPGKVSRVSATSIWQAAWEVGARR